MFILGPDEEAFQGVILARFLLAMASNCAIAYLLFKQGKKGVRNPRHGPPHTAVYGVVGEIVC